MTEIKGVKAKNNFKGLNVSFAKPSPSKGSNNPYTIPSVRMMKAITGYLLMSCLID